MNAPVRTISAIINEIDLNSHPTKQQLKAISCSKHTY